MAIHKHLFVLLIAALWLLQITHAYKHHLKVTHDNRRQFFIENFGFKTGGVFHLEVKDFKVMQKVNGKETELSYSDYKNKVYFLQRITKLDPTEVLQENMDEFSCKNDALILKENVIKGKDGVDFPDWNVDPVYEDTIQEDRQGFYNLYFINCLNADTTVSFTMKLEQYNYDNGQKDYLPVGLSPIPVIYGIFTILYVIIFIIWIFGYMRGQGNILNKVHYLMTVLVFLYILSLFFYAMEQHFVKIDGKPGGWEIAYYIFAVLKTSFFFVIVTLIGTGWSFFKPFLSDKDKKIIMVVIPLQVLDNIAMVFVGVDDPGSRDLFSWRDIFRLVDIICCGAVLIPIIWSIKHLREASQSDGKAARNLQKLKLFRQFYLIVVSYIYFTRIIIILLDATLQYNLAWLGNVFSELATLCFFVVVGYKFRPVSGNPYFNVDEEDAARSEEMQSVSEVD